MIKQIEWLKELVDWAEVSPHGWKWEVLLIPLGVQIYVIRGFNPMDGKLRLIPIPFEDFFCEHVRTIPWLDFERSKFDPFPAITKTMIQRMKQQIADNEEPQGDQAER